MTKESDVLIVHDLMVQTLHNNRVVQVEYSDSIFYCQIVSIPAGLGESKWFSWQLGVCNRWTGK